MRSDWIGNQGLTSTGLCKLGEKFGFYFKCSEKPLGIFKQDSMLYFQKATLTAVGRMAQR